MLPCVPQSIEKRMEMFRKLERESKTKAYSNIGLMKEEELEPEEVCETRLAVAVAVALTVMFVRMQEGAPKKSRMAAKLCQCARRPGKQQRSASCCMALLQLMANVVPL